MHLRCSAAEYFYAHHFVPNRLHTLMFYSPHLKSAYNHFVPRVVHVDTLPVVEPDYMTDHTNSTTSLTLCLGGEQVAEQLGMNLAAVYKAKSNVLKLLQEEVQSLEQTEFA